MSSRGFADPGLNAERVRRDNLGRVLRELHLAGSLSRSDLVSRTLLDRSTIGTLVEDLVRRGLVSETVGRGDGMPGRPSSLVDLRKDGVRVLAIDLAAGSNAAAIIGLAGHVHGQVRLPRSGGIRTPRVTIDSLLPRVRELLAAAGGRSTIAVGIAVAGVVSRSDGVVETAPGLGWEGVPLAELVADRLDLDLPVFIGNEADLGARAEHVRGAGVGADDLLYVSGEIGGGAILDGRSLASEDGRPCEFGHIPVNPDGERCECGSIGCWRTEVGAEALFRRAGVAAGGGEAGGGSAADGGGGAADGGARRADGGASLQRVIRAVASGEPRAVEAMDVEARWLGIGLAGLLNVLGPQRIVLGGFLANIYPCVVERLRDEIDRRTLRTVRANLEIVPGKLGEDAALLGAAELALEPVLQDPTLVSAAEITPGS